MTPATRHRISGKSRDAAVGAREVSSTSGSSGGGTTTNLVLRNASLLLISQIATKSIAFINFLILTRLLGSFYFGELSFGLSYAGLFVVISYMGIDTIVTRDIAQKRRPGDTLVSNSLALRLVLSVMTLGAAVAGSFLFGYSAHLRIVMFLFAVVVLEDMYSRLPIAVFRAHQKMEYEAIVTLLEKLLIFGGLLAAFSLRAGVFAAGMVYIGANAAKIVLSLHLLKKHFERPSLAWDLRYWRSLVKESLPFATVFVLWSISYRIDAVMLEAMKGAAAVGWYSAPYRIIETLTFIPEAVGSALLPAVASLYANSRWKVAGGVRQSIRLLVFVGIGMAVGGCLLSKELLGIVLGGEFGPSVPAFQILVWSLLFIFLEFVTFASLAATRRQSKLMLISAIAVVLNVSLNLIFIPRYSLLAASAVTVITEATSVALALYFVRRALGEPVLSFDIVKYIIAGAGMGLAIAALKPIGWVLAGVVGSSVYVMLSFLLRGIRDADIRMVRDFVARRGSA